MINYDKLAPYYDRLKKLVYGSSIDEATAYHLNLISDSARILIVGGGSGELLTHLKPSHQVIFLDQSRRMIELAKNRLYACQVNFVQEDVFTYQFQYNFDLIVTPFFLDSFQDSEVEKLLKQMGKNLKRKGHWLLVDFFPQNRSHKFLVFLMYTFFELRLAFGRSIPDFANLFEMNDFKLIKSNGFYANFIQSRFYEKIAE